MPRPVADAHLLAYAEAWPFFGESAFGRILTHLGRTEHMLLDAQTQPVGDELDEALRTRGGGRSLDVLRSLRDHAWFDGSLRHRIPLAHHLERLGRRVVEPDGDRAVLARDGDVAERLEHHRWLSLLIPSDLLIAARYASMPGLAPPTDHLSLCTPSLSAMLHEAPIAETHLHIGAGLPFELLWTGLVASLRAGAPRAADFPQATTIPFGTPDRFVDACKAAVITRLVLARFLRDRGRVGACDLASFGHDTLPVFADAIASVTGARSALQMLRAALQTMLTGHRPPSISSYELGLLYVSLATPARRRPVDSVEELAHLDPLATWISPTPGRSLPETHFLTRSLAYLLTEGACDAAFARLFLQYVRVRCMTFRYLVEEPGTAGLDWFKRHYDRIKPLAASLKSVRFGSALRLDARDLRLGAFEGRTAPDEGWASIRDELRSSARQAARHSTPHGDPRPEIGVILHFLKERGTQRRLHADPRQPGHEVRFGAWAKKRFDEANAIVRLLDVHPRMLLLLRGLDAASTELSVPTWPFVPIFHRVRDAARRAADWLAWGAPELGARALRATFHAGEDYRRLIEGLRRIHELIETGILLAGDRIGHGLALGHAPDGWASGWDITYQPVEDRIDDLVWELDRYARGDLACDAARSEFARSEALRLAALVYPRSFSFTVDDLREARRLRHDPAVLTHLGFPFLRRPRENLQPAWELLVAYLSDAGTFLRGCVPMKVVVTRSEKDLLVAAQSWLLRTLAAREITIESNPSSNLLIGDFLALDALPSFRLQPFPGMSEPAGVRLPLSINSDDPVSFATSLADEYAHLHGALLRHRIGSADALDWLRARREDGYRSRFTLAASAVPAILESVARPSPWLSPPISRSPPAARAVSSR